MRNKLLVIGSLLVAIAGCSDESSKKDDHPTRMTGSAGAISTYRDPTALPLSTVAFHPDRGELLAYERNAMPVNRGATKWYPVKLSEEHALRAVATGKLRVNTPEGRPMNFQYKRHVEHTNGNWTWVGRMEGAEPGREAVLTFGEKAVFGSIPYDNAEPLKLAMSDGRTWLVQTDPVLAAAGHGATPTSEPDYVIPATSGSNRGGPKTMASPPPIAYSHTGTHATVDIALGYTSGLAASLGGPSQAITRLTHLVDLTNQAYIASGVDGELRLVRTVLVEYPDATSNRAALFELTGVDCSSGTGVSLPDGSLDCTSVGQPTALEPLIEAREIYGADVVSLVRRFDAGNGSCGIGWLLGAGQQEITSADAAYAMSVVSDTSAAGSCRDDTLAHEVGHNLGLQHDRETARGTDDTNGDGDLLDPEEYGRYPYSFAHSTGADAGNFYTIMAVRRPGQVGYLVFSSPNVTSCGGQPCGVADQTDNARSLNQTIPVASGFRASIVPAGNVLNLRTIAKLGGSGRTEVHELAGASVFQSFSDNRATVLHQTGRDHGWEFQFGDFNRDGVKDLFSINKNGASGRTEVHVMDGQSKYAGFVLNVATALYPSGVDSTWVFRVGHYNSDGILDIYAIGRQGGSGRTEVHVLDGATSYQTYLAHIATALHRTGGDGDWNFELADFNSDGITDLYAIKKNAALSTEVHVLNGATSFQSFLLQTRTALHPTGADYSWVFKVGDYDQDGVPDLYAIARLGGSLRTEVHVLNGASSFQTFSAHVATLLHQTGSDGSWAFELVDGS